MIRPAARLVLTAFASLAASAAPTPPEPGWPQFGGPTRDFRVATQGLRAWPDSGPQRLWQRELGDGYSGIATDGRTLFTLYRLGSGDEEAVVALDAESGRTLWERRDPAAFRPRMNMEHGPGPHTTPLLAGGRLFSVGIVGRFQALEAKSGSVLWAHELWKDLGGKVMNRGYSCSAR